MIHSIIHNIVIYLHSHPHSAGFIAFLISFSEALAVIGTLVPGSVTMTAVGILIGSKVIPGWNTLIWAIFGAISGDFFSYLIGLHYKTRIHNLWFFRKYPSWLEKGEKFFQKHGGKSIFIGRFFGPARPMIPLIAGSFNMKLRKFLSAAIPSACLWAIGYMIPGILIGALSLELPTGMAFEFIVMILILISFFVFLTWFIHYCSKHFAKKINKAIS